MVGTCRVCVCVCVCVCVRKESVCGGMEGKSHRVDFRSYDAIPEMNPSASPTRYAAQIRNDNSFRMVDGLVVVVHLSMSSAAANKKQKILYVICRVCSIYSIYVVVGESVVV